MPETIQAPAAGDAIPDRIDVAARVFATRNRTHFVLSFPWHPEAQALVRQWVSAHWHKPSGGWLMDAHRHEAVRKALEEVSVLLRERGVEVDAPEPRAPTHPGRAAAGAAGPSRIKVADDGTVTAGSLLETGAGWLVVERLGASFIAGSGGRNGRAASPGKLMRYAYHRPATEAEIEAALALKAGQARAEVVDTTMEP